MRLTGHKIERSLRRRTPLPYSTIKPRRGHSVTKLSDATSEFPAYHFLSQRPFLSLGDVDIFMIALIAAAFQTWRDHLALMPKKWCKDSRSQGAYSILKCTRQLGNVPTPRSWGKSLRRKYTQSYQSHSLARSLSLPCSQLSVSFPGSDQSLSPSPNFHW